VRRLSCVLGALAVIVIVLVSTEGALAQSLPPPPASSTGLAKMPVFIRTGAVVSNYRVKGMVTFRTSLPRTLEAKSVSYALDGSTIGVGTNAPFFLVDWDSKLVKDGECTVVASGKNEAGVEVWSGRATLTVSNSGSPAPQPGAPAGPALAPRPGAPVIPGQPGVAATPGGAGAVTGRPANGVPPGGRVFGPPPVGPGGRPDAFGVELKPYHSDKYKFDVLYPAGVQISDKSAAMKPKRPGSFWVAFSVAAGGKALYAVNVRYQRVTSPSSPDRYAKYNPYLLKWERAEVNGLSGFKTTSGLKETKRVIHRTLLVDGASVWMLNLTDVTGGDPEISKKMFERIVASLNQPLPEGLRGPAGPGSRVPRVAPGPPAAPGAPPAPPGPGVAPAPPPPGPAPNGGSGTGSDVEPLDEEGDEEAPPAP